MTDTPSASPGYDAPVCPVAAGGAKLFFLSKYSPDLNPIEQVFAKLKHLLRKAAARTVEAVCAAIGQGLQAFTPEECANYLTNSGYRC
jgi:transposase